MSAPAVGLSTPATPDSGPQRDQPPVREHRRRRPAAALARSLSGAARLRADAQPLAEAASPAPAPPLDAAEVVVLVHDAALFGVAERGLWHMSNVGATIPRRLWREKDSISILSASPAGAPAPDGPAPSLVMAASTATRFVYARYKVVVAVDVSASMFVVDAHSGARVVFDGALGAIAALLRGAVERMECGGAPPTTGGSGARGGEPAVEFAPELHVSVVAQPAISGGGGGSAGAGGLFAWPRIADSDSQSVPTDQPMLLVHGFSLTRGNVEELVAEVARGLRAAVAAVAAATASRAAWAEVVTPPVTAAAPHSPLALPTGAVAAPSAVQPAACAPTPTIAPLLGTAVNTLKLLPGDAAPLLIIVTDGVTAMPETAAYDSITMAMLRHDIIACVLQLGDCSGVHASLGAVPDSDALQFVTLATGGFRRRARNVAAFAAPRVWSDDGGGGSGGGGSDARAESPVRVADPVTVASAASAASAGARRRGPAPPFTTAAWSKLQQQLFVRTSAVPVAARRSDGGDAFAAGSTSGGGGSGGAEASANARRTVAHASAPPQRAAPVSSVAASAAAHGIGERAGATTPGTALSQHGIAATAAAAAADGIPRAGGVARLLRAPPALAHVASPLMRAVAQGAASPHARLRGGRGAIAVSPVRDTARTPRGSASAGDGSGGASDSTPPARSAVAAPSLATARPRSTTNVPPRGTASAAAAAVAAAVAAGGDDTFPWSGPPPPEPESRVRVATYRVPADPHALIAARLKEGFRHVLEAGGGSARNAEVGGAAGGAGGVDGNVSSDGTGVSGDTDAGDAALPPAENASPSRRPCATLPQTLPRPQLARMVLAWQPFVSVLYTLRRATSDGGAAATARRAATRARSRGRSGDDRAESRGRRRGPDELPAAQLPPPPPPLEHLRVTVSVTARRVFLTLFLAATALDKAAAAGVDIRTSEPLLQLYRRLTPASAEKRRAHALRSFLTVLRQVDFVVGLLGRPPALLLAIGDSAPHESAMVAAAAGALGAWEESTRSLPVGGGAPGAALATISAAQGGATTHAGAPPAAASTPVAAVAPASPPARLRPIRAPAAATVPAAPLSLPLRAFLAAVGDLSVGAWHRWFDVERFEVAPAVAGPGGLASSAADFAAPRLHAMLAGDAAVPLSAPSASARIMLDAVHGALRSWADAELPPAAELFSWDGDGAGGSAPEITRAAAGGGPASRPLLVKFFGASPDVSAAGASRGGGGTGGGTPVVPRGAARGSGATPHEAGAPSAASQFAPSSSASFALIRVLLHTAAAAGGGVDSDSLHGAGGGGDGGDAVPCGAGCGRPAAPPPTPRRPDVTFPGVVVVLVAMIGAAPPARISLLQNMKRAVRESVGGGRVGVDSASPPQPSPNVAPPPPPLTCAVLAAPVARMCIAPELTVGDGGSASDGAAASRGPEAPRLCVACSTESARGAVSPQSGFFREEPSGDAAEVVAGGPECGGGGGTDGDGGSHALHASICCGGTSIPRPLLTAILWRRRWEWRLRLSLPSLQSQDGSRVRLGLDSVARAAARALAEAVLTSRVRPSAYGDDSASGVVVEAAWTPTRWAASGGPEDVVRSSDSASGTRTQPVAGRYSLHFLRLVRLAVTRPATAGVVVGSASTGAAPAVVAPRPCCTIAYSVVQQGVDVVMEPSPVSDADGGGWAGVTVRLVVGLAMEPQIGSAALRLIGPPEHTPARDSGGVPSSGAAAGSGLRTISTLSTYAALCRATHAADAHAVLAAARAASARLRELRAAAAVEAGFDGDASSLAETVAVDVRVTDSMTHTGTATTAPPPHTTATASATTPSRNATAADAPAVLGAAPAPALAPSLPCAPAGAAFLCRQLAAAAASGPAGVLPCATLSLPLPPPLPSPAWEMRLQRPPGAADGPAVWSATELPF